MRHFRPRIRLHFSAVRTRRQNYSEYWTAGAWEYETAKKDTEIRSGDLDNPPNTSLELRDSGRNIVIPLLENQMNKTPSSRASWRYVIAGILLIAATMAGGSAVAHANGRSSQSTKAQSTKASGPKAHPRSHGMSGTRHHHKRHHHWKKSHRPAPVLSPKQTTEPTTPTPQTGFPNASNTGVPAGTKLAAYT